MKSVQVKKYDALVDAHTLTLLDNLTLKVGDEDTALHVTILSFEKLWHYMEAHGEPQNTLEWLQMEAEKIMT
ncbi:hypothetical protein ACP3VU_14335 [Vibrio sp. PNB23_22_6]|uniref:hypothetical protein n=1 Tax=Vibrio TaxID=662 RepID=UPI001BEDDF2F|nr:MULTISPECIES: hypothetical protein [Vibrio]BBM66924.1 hypothetical protein VA249_35700 [Vibrio alfacsensis]